MKRARQTMPNRCRGPSRWWRCPWRARPALARQRIAVEAGRGIGRRAGNVEQDRAAAAAIDRADVGADQDQHGVARRHLDGQRRHQRDAERRGEPGHAADDDAEQGRAEGERERGRGRDIPPSECRKWASPSSIPDPYGRRTRKMCWNMSATTVATSGAIMLR